MKKTITNKQRHAATNKILQSTLGLLVVLREALAANGVPESNPLHAAIYTHANLISSLLPNDLLIPASELARIRAVFASGVGNSQGGATV